MSCYPSGFVRCCMVCKSKSICTRYGPCSCFRVFEVLVNAGHDSRASMIIPDSVRKVMRRINLCSKHAPPDHLLSTVTSYDELELLLRAISNSSSYSSGAHGSYRRRRITCAWWTCVCKMDKVCRCFIHCCNFVKNVWIVNFVDWWIYSSTLSPGIFEAFPMLCLLATRLLSLASVSIAHDSLNEMIPDTWLLFCCKGTHTPWWGSISSWFPTHAHADLFKTILRPLPLFLVMWQSLTTAPPLHLSSYSHSPVSNKEHIMSKEQSKSSCLEFTMTFMAFSKPAKNIWAWYASGGTKQTKHMSATGIGSW